MNSKNILLYSLLAILASITIVISVILDLPFELVILMMGGVILLNTILAMIFFYVTPNKKIYVSLVVLFLVLWAFVDSMWYQTYALIYLMFYLSIISMGLVYAICVTQGWEKALLLKNINKSVKENDFPEALENSNQLLEINPDNYFALGNKASSLRMLREYSDSLEIANSFLEKHPKDSNFLNLKVDALINLKKIDEAEKVNEKILLKNPKDLIAISNKAQILFEKGLYQDSIDNFEKSVKMMDNKEKWIFVGLKPMKLIPVNSEIVRMWIMKGEAHKNLQQYSEALESFNKALEFNPDSEEAQKNKDEVSGMING